MRMRIKRRYCSVHDSLSGEWDNHCKVRERSLVHDECKMETVLLAPTTDARRVQKLLDTYLEPDVRKVNLD